MSSFDGLRDNPAQLGEEASTPKINPGQLVVELCAASKRAHKEAQAKLPRLEIGFTPGSDAKTKVAEINENGVVYITAMNATPAIAREVGLWLLEQFPYPIVSKP